MISSNIARVLEQLEDWWGVLGDALDEFYKNQGCRLEVCRIIAWRIMMSARHEHVSSTRAKVGEVIYLLSQHFGRVSVVVNGRNSDLCWAMYVFEVDMWSEPMFA